MRTCLWHAVLVLSLLSGCSTNVAGPTTLTCTDYPRGSVQESECR